MQTASLKFLPGRMSRASSGARLTPTAAAEVNRSESTTEHITTEIESQYPRNLPFNAAGVSDAKHGTGDCDSKVQHRSWWQRFCESCTVKSTKKERPYAGFYTGDQHFMQRNGLSDAENFYYNKLEHHSHQLFLKVTSGVCVLKFWPTFFESTEKAGEEIRDHLVTLYTTYIVAETLLAAVAMQPFVTSVTDLSAWQQKVYGLLWMLVIINTFLGISVTTLFLGWLLAIPGKLTYIWVCEIGAWNGVPAALGLLSTFTILFAICFTSWFVYGTLVGIFCVVVETFVVLFAIFAGISLQRVAHSITKVK